MLTVLSRPDIRDWTALPADGTDYRIGLGGGLAGLRIAASAVAGLRRGPPGGGGVVRPRRWRCWPIWVRGSSWSTRPSAGPAASSPGPGSRRRRGCWRSCRPSMRARLDPGFVAMAEQGARYSRAEIQDAMLERGELGVAMQGFLAGLRPPGRRPARPCRPSQPASSIPDPERPERWSEWATFSYPFNLTQQPAISRALRASPPMACRSGCSSSPPSTRTRWCCGRRGRSRRPARSRCPKHRAGPSFDLASGRMLGSRQQRRCGAPMVPREGIFMRSFIRATVLGDGVGAGARRRGRGQDAGLLLGRQPGGLQPACCSPPAPRSTHRRSRSTTG